jgi:hypothetical protein
MKTRFVLSLFVAASLPAASIVQGGSLFTQAHADQVAAWLGEGDLILTNIYAYTGSGYNEGPNWHGHVDGRGRTVSLIQTNLGLIGGYNPQSWRNTGGYNLTPVLAERTAFIFNLTTGLLQRQILSNLAGQFQTINHQFFGPSFGAGSDIVIDWSSSPYSAANGESYGTGPNLFGGSSTTLFEVQGVETYTIGTTIPEPGTMATFLAGFAALALRAKAAASKRP